MTEESPGLGSLLFGPATEGLDGHVADELEADPALGELVDELGGTAELTSRKMLARAILENAPDLLGVPVGRILAGGWRKWDELRGYADPSRYPPDQTIVVELARHEIHSRHQPRLELIVNDRAVRAIELEAELVLSVEAAVLTVRDGMILSARTGTCDVSGDLEWKGHSLARWRSRRLDVPGTLEFHPPVEIEPSPD